MFENIGNFLGIGAVLESDRSSSKGTAAAAPSGPASAEELEGVSLRFSFEDLSAATRSFGRWNRLGHGAAGEVYHGYLASGTEIAVKAVPDAAGQGFYEEVMVLSRFRHPHLVTLLGWAQHPVNNDMFLVYEYMRGGDVGKRLYGCKKGNIRFEAHHRCSVALDTACGLSYMVNSKPKAFHRDIKTSNILLDATGKAKLGDFGLAGMAAAPGDNHLKLDQISGTPGYLCPELLQTGIVTEQSEVYAFGVVLLELLLNDLPAKRDSQGEIIYPIMEAIDPDREGSMQRLLQRLDSTVAWERPLLDELARLALWCVQTPQASRPLLADLVACLRWPTVPLPSTVLAQDGLGETSTRGMVPQQLPLPMPETFHSPASTGGLGPKLEGRRLRTACGAQPICAAEGQRQEDDVSEFSTRLVEM
eukprot:TRINITY_DN18326_c0_g1_i2.p1 TRINITY_DN18326_c0_g1~~TRINITY_DN18326_c0_g1_i2.p1  ORF type:complete len:418 (-),score=81.24 TRINITY_DN18326_c0_g1_i2:474-1727(-)